MANLPTLLNAIPIAQDGHVITPEYHNTLRDALKEMAGQIGTGEAESIRSYAPVFLPVADAGVQEPQWVLTVGMAVRPPGANASAKGWFLVNLPDSTRIRSLTVTGNRIGTVIACTVQLFRFLTTDASSIPLVTMSLKKPMEQFSLTREFSADLSPELQVVDNSKCYYLIVAELVRAAADAVVELYSFQVQCSR